eukprot:TRINITY_DN7334_c0_g1_i1.p1 TRINITY_DN7334_c0_g1~~TRINITY_DN7334_c0_g1_i1.p1  ORF type:complete len:526 (+),score=119.35 TRINITY_DN7334_c0_g1_i1:52-1629(+)
MVDSRMSGQRKRLSSHLSEILEGGESSATCVLCTQGLKGRLGPLYESVEGGLVVRAHSFCLLFSPGLSQCEDESRGINGFLREDILAEQRRSRRLKCFYCKGGFASIGCSISSCVRSYHLPCAIENEAHLTFKDTFDSFCKSHAPRQKIPKHKQGGKESLKECSICLSEIPAEDVRCSLWSPCCSSWAHKSCLQDYANSSGYFFKCPLCNDTKEFCEEMRSFGIFVPEQDAAWERVPHAFQELNERYGTCDRKEPCLCPQGRSHDVDYSKWEIILCHLCGSSGIHAECGGLFSEIKEGDENYLPKWACELCHNVSRKLPQHHFYPISKQKKKGHSLASRSIRSILRRISFKVTEEVGHEKDGGDQLKILLSIRNREGVSLRKPKTEYIPSPLYPRPKEEASSNPTPPNPTGSNSSSKEEEKGDEKEEKEPNTHDSNHEIHHEKNSSCFTSSSIEHFFQRQPSTSPSNAPPLQPPNRLKRTAAHSSSSSMIPPPPSKRRKTQSPPQKVRKSIDSTQRFISSFFFKL